MDRQKPEGWPLATVVTFHCVWIIALFMALYAWAEVAIFNESVLFALFKHTYHVAILAFALTMLLSLVIRHQVGRPASRLVALLYRVGAGDADLPRLRTHIRELKEIEGGIGLMKDRMHLGAPGEAMEQAEEALMRLRLIAKQIRDTHPDQAQATLNSVVELGESVGLITEKGRALEWGSFPEEL